MATDAEREVWRANSQARARALVGRTVLAVSAHKTCPVDGDPEVIAVITFDDGTYVFVTTLYTGTVPATVVVADVPRCPECNKPLPNDAETELHDHRDDAHDDTVVTLLVTLPDGRRQCPDCTRFCWRDVNGGSCVEGGRMLRPLVHDDD